MKIRLDNIFNRLRERVRVEPLSPINVLPKVSIFNNSNKDTKSKNELGLPTIFKPVKDLPIVSLSDRPLNTIKEEFVSEEFLDPKVKEAEEAFDILDSAVDFQLVVTDDVYVETPDIRNIRYPKEIKGGDFIGYDVDFEISFDTTDSTSYVNIDIGNVKNALRKSPDEQTQQRGLNSKKGGRGLDRARERREERRSKPTNSNKPNNRFLLKLNVKDVLINYLDLEGTEDIDIINIPFRLTPVNANSRKQVNGKTETFNVRFDKGDLDIPRSVAINRIVEGFQSQLKTGGFSVSKYLTHLVHLGDGNNKLISNWIGVKQNPEARDGESSLILKLYEPLAPEIQPNQKLWISKLQSEPIIETVTLVSDGDEYCPPLQGPNFSLETNTSVGYQIYDDLLASGSGTSTNLVNEYTSTLGIDTEKLTIQYVDDSNYTFENYVRFGSAEERIKNFLYKIQLIEGYEDQLSGLTGVEIEVGTIETEDGYVLLTENGLTISIDSLSITPQTEVEASRVTKKINQVIRTFDGFEKFLYSSSDSLAYPKVGNTLVSSTDSSAVSWYNSSINYAANYDKNNVNYLVNNLPEYIREDYDNEEYMLFLDMIGQHFDVIWTYINGISNSKRLEHKVINGIPDTLVSHMLESLGWDKKRAYDSQYLWEYALGQYKDGTQKYDRSLKDANEEIWRRVLNNLPYLLKNKGTSRSLKAVLATYGVPQSLLTIMEFGGPQDPTQGGSTSFTFEDRTAAIKLSGSQYIDTYWETTDYVPNSIELNVKFEEAGNHGLVYNTLNGEDIGWKLEAIQTTGSLGKVKLSISGSSELKELESNELRLFTDTYKQIVVTREETSPSHSFNLYVKEAKGGRLRIDDVQTLSIEPGSSWDYDTNLRIGGSGSAGLIGSIDEFRIWKTPLDNASISNHAKIPDAISGNNYTASASELLLRHDFEYPKNRHTSGDTEIINVSISEEYQNSGNQVTSSIAVGFANLASYPYNYESYERSVTAQVPSMGFNFANKIRFENQTLVGDLSHRARATKKSFDQAPVDSPKLGLFFSPSKELNMDILKSFGNFNIDNYIGDPRDEFNEEYTELKSLRDYYFERLNRNVQEYIQLVRNIDKSLFDVLEDLVPARAKVAKGLLIEPHILERNKQKWKRPSSERRDYESEINIDENNKIELSYSSYQGDLNVDDEISYNSTYDTYDGIVDVNDDTSLESDYKTYNTTITSNDDIILEGSAPFYVADITSSIGVELQSIVDLNDFVQVGLSDIGFGLFASASHGVVTTLDIFGNITSSRQQIYEVDNQFTEKILTQTEGWPATTNAEQVKYEYVNVNKNKRDVTIIPFGGTTPSVSGNITSVTPLNGYLPSHYKFVKNHSLGLERSFFRGSQQTSATTPDGLSPVETFTTNPNILKVADTGRGSGEPILEVD
jgi:transposase